jgi:hypothetical protein
MQKPMGGLPATLLSELYKGTINKGAIVFSHDSFFYIGKINERKIKSNIAH